SLSGHPQKGVSVSSTPSRGLIVCAPSSSTDEHERKGVDSANTPRSLEGVQSVHTFAPDEMDRVALQVPTPHGESVSTKGTHSMRPLSPSTDEQEAKGRDTGTPLASGKGVDTVNPPGDAIASPPTGLPVHEMNTKGYL